MGRSLKKGPFVEERLMKRIDAMNAAKCMMAESMFLYSSVRTW